MNITNESELVIRLQHDDVDAFDVFYKKYHHGLYTNILKLIRQPAAAQDILQEVFTTLWEKRLTLDPEQPLSSWLFAISYNKSVNFLRKTLKLELSLDEGDKEWNVSCQEDDSLSLEIRAQLLNEAISQLSPQKRKVLELCKLQGKSYKETALEMHISRHTVKEYLSNAISNIKLYIRQHGTIMILFYFHPLYMLIWQ